MVSDPHCSNQISSTTKKRQQNRKMFFWTGCITYPNFYNVNSEKYFFFFEWIVVVVVGRPSVAMICPIHGTEPIKKTEMNGLWNIQNYKLPRKYVSHVKTEQNASIKFIFLGLAKTLKPHWLWPIRIFFLPTKAISTCMMCVCVCILSICVWAHWFIDS